MKNFLCTFHTKDTRLIKEVLAIYIYTITAIEQKVHRKFHTNFSKKKNKIVHQIRLKVWVIL